MKKPNVMWMCVGASGILFPILIFIEFYFNLPETLSIAQKILFSCLAVVACIGPLMYFVYYDTTHSPGSPSGAEPLDNTGKRGD